jgi:RHS repeat-associated protein
LNGITVTNTYDNLLRRSDCGVLNASSAILAATAYGYAAAPRLSTVSDANDNTATYSYLANSPLVGQIAFANHPAGSGGMTTTKQYDFLNRLTSINSGTGGSPVSSFAYTHNQANPFVYDGWNWVAEPRAPNSVLRTYMWGTDLSGSAQGAGGVGGLHAMTACGSPNAPSYFYSFDGNENVAGLVNVANGIIAGQYEYGPFGEVIRSTGPMVKANPIRFSTKYQDDETGLNYYGYRYFDTSPGRWLSRDPSEEDGGNNLYDFVGNDGINGCDELGLWLIHRNPDNDRAVVYAEKGDTVDGLAQKIGLDDSDFQVWLKPEGNGKLPATATEVVPSCQYTIPNTYYIEFGEYIHWWDWAFGPISLWRNTLQDMKTMLVKDGYKVVLTSPSDASVASAHLNSLNIIGFAYCGHGGGAGNLIFNDKNGPGSTLAAGRQTKYGIAQLIAFGCDTATKTPSRFQQMQHYSYSPWEKSVAIRGTFYGVYDSVNIYHTWSNIIKSNGTNTK